MAQRKSKTAEAPETSQTHLPVEKSQIDYAALFAALVNKPEAVEAVKEIKAMRDEDEARFNLAELHSALARAQMKFGEIKKTKPVYNKDGGLRYHYAPLESVKAAVDGALHEEGLTYRFNTPARDRAADKETSTGFWITREVILSGYGAEIVVRKDIPLDWSGDTDKRFNKNQAIGVADTYGARYLLNDLLGLAAMDDTDGVGASPRDNGGGAPAAAEKAQDGPNCEGCGEKCVVRTAKKSGRDFFACPRKQADQLDKCGFQKWVDEWVPPAPPPETPSADAEAVASGASPFPGSEVEEQWPPEGAGKIPKEFDDVPPKSNHFGKCFEKMAKARKWDNSPAGKKILLENIAVLAGWTDTRVRDEIARVNAMTDDSDAAFDATTLIMLAVEPTTEALADNLPEFGGEKMGDKTREELFRKWDPTRKTAMALVERWQAMQGERGGAAQVEKKPATRKR